MKHESLSAGWVDELRIEKTVPRVTVSVKRDDVPIGTEKGRAKSMYLLQRHASSCKFIHESGISQKANPPCGPFTLNRTQQKLRSWKT